MEPAGLNAKEEATLEMFVAPGLRLLVPKEKLFCPLLCPLGCDWTGGLDGVNCG